MCPKWPGNSDTPSPHVWHLEFQLMVLKKAHDTPAQLLPVVVWSSFHHQEKITIVSRPKADIARIVFASGVQSVFLPPKWATVNHNRSRTDPDIVGTKLDHLGPVFCSPWN